MVNNGAGHFIQIVLCKASFFRPARIKTLHNLDFEIGSDLAGVMKIFATVKPDNI